MLAVLGLQEVTMTERVVTHTRGAALLRAWLDGQGLSQADLARRCGVGEASVCRWLRGTRRPGLDLAIAVEQLTDGAVPAASWVASC